MTLKKSTFNLIVFWIIAVFFLAGFYYFLQIRKQSPESNLGQKLEETRLIWEIIKKFSVADDQEKTFLLLFQNNLELRPAGGYIGSFGILKTKNGHLVSIETHNTNIFDGRVPDGTPIPWPMEKMLRVKDWKMRDANFSPDFKESALQAEKFYKAGQGGENFDGIIGVNADVLPAILKITGAVSIPSFDGEFNPENAVLQLEYAVEKGYREAGLDHAERKTALRELARVIGDKIRGIGYGDKLKLAEAMEKELEKKNIQLFFRDADLQSRIEKLNWGGRMDENWDGDYLFINDANLGALKSDRVIKRSAEYLVDLSKEKPEALLKIFYNHAGTQKDWLTKDYAGYLRVFVPKGSWLTESFNTGESKFGEEFNKKYFGFIVGAPLGKITEVDLKYFLPEKLKSQPYKLLIQKQSGSGTVPVKITIIRKDGTKKEFAFDLISDVQVNLED